MNSMIEEKLGFIGAGNMATALVKGLLESGLYSADQLLAADSNKEKLSVMKKNFR